MITSMQGVITALVAFLLACLIWPSVVKNRPQYYAAFACVLLLLLIDTFTLMFSGTSFGSKLIVFGSVCTGFLSIAALVLCMLFAGGLTVKDLTGEIKGTYEVLRRGETEKEIIIPQRGGGAESRPPEPADKPPVFVIDPVTGEDKPA